MPPYVIDFELEKALLQVSMLPMMATPIVDHVVAYPAPPLPVLPIDEQFPVLQASPLREGAGHPVLDVFPTYAMSPTDSINKPTTSSVSPSVQEDDVSGPPSGMAPMDQYLPRNSEVLLGESLDLPLLTMPITPRPIVEEMVLGSAVGSPAGEPVVTAVRSMPDLSRQGPFDGDRREDKNCHVGGFPKPGRLVGRLPKLCGHHI